MQSHLAGRPRAGGGERGGEILKGTRSRGTTHGDHGDQERRVTVSGREATAANVIMCIIALETRVPIATNTEHGKKETDHHLVLSVM